MKRYTIGLDLGTSAAKGVLTDGKDILKVVNKKFEYKKFALPDGAEYIGFDADEFVNAVCSAIKELAKEVDGKVYGLSVASASGNTLLLKKGKPIIAAYSWTNPPFTAESQKYFAGSDLSAMRKVCGWGYGDTFPLAHLSHIKAHAPELLKRADVVCMTTEYLLYKLTGKWGIDRSSATPFYLANQVTGKYEKDLLEKFGIKEEMLPPLGETGDLLGTTLAGTESLTGIKEGAKVFLGSFDHPSGARASGICEKGEMLLSCGTSWVGFFLHEDRDFVLDHGFMSDPYLSKRGLWGAMFSFCKISESVDKVLNGYVSCGKDKITLFNEYAAKAEKGADGLFINLEKDSDKDFSAYSKENICRALMEGAAYLVKEKLKTLEKIGVKIHRIVMAGGPSQSVLWKEIIEDITGVKIEIRYGVNSGATGAALLAFNDGNPFPG